MEGEREPVAGGVEGEHERCWWCHKAHNIGEGERESAELRASMGADGVKKVVRRRGGEPECRRG